MWLNAVYLLPRSTGFTKHVVLPNVCISCDQPAEVLPDYPHSAAMPGPHNLGFCYRTHPGQHTNFYFSQHVWTAEKKAPKSQLNITTVVSCSLTALAQQRVAAWCPPLSSVVCPRRIGMTRVVMTLTFSAAKSWEIPCGVFLLNSSALQLWKWSCFALIIYCPLFFWKLL